MLNKITTKYSKFSPEFPCKDACVHAKSFRRVHIFVPLWTIACLAPLSMGFSRREYWSGLPCPPPGDLSNPGIEPSSLMSHALAGRFFTTSTTWVAHTYVYLTLKLIPYLFDTQKSFQTILSQSYQLRCIRHQRG